jgi:hypothetical protein
MASRCVDFASIWDSLTKWLDFQTHEWRLSTTAGSPLTLPVPDRDACSRARSLFALFCCVQMSSPSGAVAHVDRKSPAAPSTRLTALYDALPFVPKPVVQLIDEYLRRLPPSELIRELSRTISPALAVDDVTAAQLSLTGRTVYMGVTVRSFYCGTQLYGLLDDGFVYDDELNAAPVTRSDPSELLRRLRDAIILKDPITPALKGVLGEDAGALCCITLGNVLASWCMILFAVPDGLLADQVLGDLSGAAPIKALSERAPLCGLCIHQGLFD